MSVISKNINLNYLLKIVTICSSRALMEARGDRARGTTKMQTFFTTTRCLVFHGQRIFWNKFKKVKVIINNICL